MLPQTLAVGLACSLAGKLVEYFHHTRPVILFRQSGPSLCPEYLNFAEFFEMRLLAIGIQPLSNEVAQLSGPTFRS